MKSVLISIQPYWVFLIVAKAMGWNIGKQKTVESPCYNCIDTVDLALHKPNAETEFVNYEKE